MHIRNATIEDSKDILAWRNDINTRKMSFNSTMINYDDHKEWFCKALQSQNCIIYIAENNGKIGVCRFNICQDTKTALISINLNPSFRGKGLAKEFLVLCVKKFRVNYQFDIVAKVRSDNSISFKVFKNASFFENHLSDKDITLINPILPLRFEKVTIDQSNILFNLLKNRKYNISHKELPSKSEHYEFIKNNPYLHWFIIYHEKPIGTFYIQKDNSIGLNINIFEKHYISQTLSFILKEFKPSPNKRSLIPEYFYLNTAPDNDELLEIYKMLGLKQIQISHKLSN